jgi:SHS family lactate transporter-like MFS transporter
MSPATASVESASALTHSEATHTLLASFLGWALGAFDFSCWSSSPTIATEFHRSVPDIAFTITMTLAMRPGGHLSSDGAPTYGYRRRMPLMAIAAACRLMVLYSVIEVTSGLAPTNGWFLFMRAI